MGDRTKIDWCDASWNPVTGCLHECTYCYARGIARRFGNHMEERVFEHKNTEGEKVLLHELDKPFEFHGYGIVNGVHVDLWSDGKSCPYPFDFEPTLHRYRLDIPVTWKKPRNIFVCSMADLFGAWVPDEWIQEVFDACREAPQHRYLFLTKNPDRYDELVDKGILTVKDTNFWLGSTITNVLQDRLHYNTPLHTFMSCEPMLAPWPKASEPNKESMIRGWLPEWVIFGAETGNRKDKIIPEKSWVDNAVQMCRNMGSKVFMKESLREIMGDDFVQEFPWEGAAK